MGWVGWSPSANFRSFIVYPVWVIERKQEAHSFKEVSLSLTKLATSSIHSSSCSWKNCCSGSCCSVMLTPCDPLDCSPPGSSVHGIFQARILEWIAIFLLQRIFLIQGSNLHLLYFLHWQAYSLPAEPSGKPQYFWCVYLNKYIIKINFTWL